MAAKRLRNGQGIKVSTAVGLTWTIICFCVSWQLFDKSGDGENTTGTWALAFMIAAVIPIGVWFFKVIFNLGSYTYDSAQIASQPVPDLHAIRAQLAVELGREPTLIECTQVQQALHNRKVEAAGQAVAGVALLGLIDHNLHKR
jgi:hypothetical protein